MQVLRKFYPVTRSDGDGVSVQKPVVGGQWLIVLIIVWPIIFIPACFIVFYATRSKYYYNLEGLDQVPTISVSGSQSPASYIFTYGLHFEGMLIATFFVMLFFLYEEKIERCVGSTRAIGAVEQNGSESKREVEGPFVSEPDVYLSMPEDGTPPPKPSTPTSGPAKVKLSTQHEYELILKALEACTCFGCPQWQSRCCKCDPLAADDSLEHTSTENAPRVRQYLHHWNRALLYMGLAASFCMTIVGTVSLSVQADLHGFFAFFMFALGVLHSVFFYYHITKHVGACERTSWLPIVCHQICICITLPFNVFCSIGTGIVFLSCGMSNKTCESFTANMFPVLEFTTIIFVILYLATFYDEFRRVSLDVSVAPFKSS